MKRPVLTLASGRKLILREACCLRCRRLIGACLWDGCCVIWDALGFSQDGRIRFQAHLCRAELVELALKLRARADGRPPLDPRD